MKRFHGNLADLKDLPPFSWFHDAQIAAAIPTIQHRRYPARTIVQRGGSPPEGLFLLLSGRVQVIYGDAEGREFVAETVGPHDFFGETGLFDGQQVASFRSTVPCELLFIPRSVVLENLKTNSRAAMCMLEKVIKRLRASQQKLAQLALTTAHERITAALLENASDGECEPVVQVGSEQIARLAGCSREMVSRIIRRLIEARVVQRHGRKLVILDREALARPGVTHGNRRRSKLH